MAVGDTQTITPLTMILGILKVEYIADPNYASIPQYPYIQT